MKYIPRWAAKLLAERLASFPVVVVTGPRQAGKSTMLREDPATAGYAMLDLDDMELRRRLSQDPSLAWEGRQRVVIDEVQRLPDLLPSLKAHVDRADPEFRAVLSGSANLLLMRDVSESLAGRAAYLPLGPFAVGEWEAKEAPELLRALLSGSFPPEGSAPARDPAAEIWRGLLPPARRHASPPIWWESYVRTYLERDLRDLASVHSLPDFRRVMELVAVRTGQVVNETRLSRQCAVSQPTVHRYVNLLEVTLLIRRLPAYTVNRGKRIAKRPKLHVADVGLAAFLQGLHTPEEVRAAREFGALFEGLVVHHLGVLASLLSPAARLFHWRTSDGKEVDVVLSHGRSLVAFECKATRRPLASHARHLRLFRELHPECRAGVLVHAGDRVEHLGAGVVALPWALLAGADEPATSRPGLQ